ncbi:MAG: hypothetical protein AB1815_11800 [Bacillota bacterium]
MVKVYIALKESAEIKTQLLTLNSQNYQCNRC